ncbi:hypothetical protein [Bradyrhizobium sp. UFLA05-112]
MNQVNARREIIREWRSLPKELRQRDEQAAAFAMQIKDKYNSLAIAQTHIKPSWVGFELPIASARAWSERRRSA